MLCGRDDLPISNYFDHCLTIATNSVDTSEDQHFYIDHEIDHICQRRKNSLFASSSKDFPSRLKTILKEKGGCLFRWIEIQLDIFRVKNFRTCSEIEEQLQWLETHTQLDVLDNEYARLFALLKEHPPFDQFTLKTLPNDELALKMLRLIACSEFELGAEDLAEAMAASRCVNDEMELTPDDVRRILVGFIAERKPTGLNRRDLTRSEAPIVQLGHSSVLEYLTGNVEDFSTLTQYSDAALLCFQRISASGKHAELPPKADLPSSDKPSAEKLSFFLKYSCVAWPVYCRRAFDEDPRCSLVEQVKDFILSDGYIRWNEIIRSHELNHQYLHMIQYRESRWGTYPKSFQPGYFELESLSCDDVSAGPGFIVARYGLTELLEFHEIRALIDLQHKNSQGMTLLRYTLNYSDASTVDRLIELNPNQIMPSEGQNTLEVATMRGYAAIVENLLNNGEDVDVRIGNAYSVLFNLTKIFSHHRWWIKNRAESQAYLNTIQILLQHGAPIFEIDDNCQSLLHWAAIADEHALPRLFIEYGKLREESGLVGSVQRLLRAKSDRGETPIDWARFWHKEYLQSELDAAVLRNGGQILYDFGTPDVTQRSEVHLNKESLMEFYKHSFVVKKYNAWFKRRHEELDEQYEAYRRHITAGNRDEALRS